jgi:hypothetical protein
MAPWKDKKSSALLKLCIVNTPLVVNINNVIQVYTYIVQIKE